MDFLQWVNKYYPKQLNGRYYSSTYELEHGKGKEEYEIYQIYLNTTQQ